MNISFSIFEECSTRILLTRLSVTVEFNSGPSAPLILSFGLLMSLRAFGYYGGVHLFDDSLIDASM